MAIIEAVVRRRPGPRLTATMLAVLGCSVATIAGAQPPPPPDASASSDQGGVEVAQTGCPRLDLGRLRELFALEVNRVVDRVRPVLLRVMCEGDRSVVRIESQKLGSAERSMVGAVESAEAERLLALAAAQLVFAAWLDAQPEENRRADPSPPQAGTPVSEAPPILPASPPATSRAPVFDAGVEAGAFARTLGALVAGYNVGLLATLWQRTWGLELYAGVNRTAVTRPLGGAELVVGELGVGAAWRSSAEAPLGFELSAGPALAGLDLRGIAPAANVAATSVTGLTIDGRAAAGLRYRSGGLWILARLEVGYLVSGPDGTITGDSPIATGGPWTAANLGMGGAW
jgi:hypothetical protein